MLVLRVVVGVVGALTGTLVVVLTATLGHCGAFGGRCPSPEGLQGDVYGSIAAGASLALVVPILAWRPCRRGVLTAVAVMAVVAAPLTFALGTSLVRR